VGLVSLGWLLDLSTVELALLLRSLESTVTELGGSIDVLELDVFVELSLGGWEQGLSQDKGSLLGSDTASLDHDVVISDNTVMWEATHWGNVLLGQIALSGGIVLGTVSLSLTNSVDSLVALGSVVITRLTGSWDGEGDLGWMPGSDTTDLSQTSMSLSGKLPDAPSLGNAGESLTLGNTDDIDNLVGAEDLIDLKVLFELALDELNLIGGAATVNLNFENVGLLGSEVALQVDLGVADGSDGGAELVDSLLPDILLVLVVDVLGEGLLLGSVPVLVEPSLELVGEGVGPDSAQSSKSLYSLDVSNESDNLEWWSFDDGNGLDDFLLVKSGVDSVNVSGDVGHTSLETGESSEVWLLGWVILREGPDLSSMLPGSLPWEES